MEQVQILEAVLLGLPPEVQKSLFFQSPLGALSPTKVVETLSQGNVLNGINIQREGTNHKLSISFNSWLHTILVSENFHFITINLANQDPVQYVSQVKKRPALKLALD